MRDGIRDLTATFREEATKATIRTTAVAAVLAAAGLVAGCGGGTPPGAGGGTVTTVAESNAGSDIPDNQPFVPFTPPTGLFSVSVPDGWAQSSDGPATLFSDKLNTLRIETRPLDAAPNTESVAVHELPAIAAATPGYRLGMLTAVQRSAGPVMLVIYQATSTPSPATGKPSTTAVERYEYWHDGHEVMLILSGPVGADNVARWHTITDSLHWQ